MCILCFSFCHTGAKTASCVFRENQKKKNKYYIAPFILCSLTEITWTNHIIITTSEIIRSSNFPDRLEGCNKYKVIIACSFDSMSAWFLQHLAALFQILLLYIYALCEFRAGCALSLHLCNIVQLPAAVLCVMFACSLCYGNIVPISTSITWWNEHFDTIFPLI